MSNLINGLKWHQMPSSRCWIVKQWLPSKWLFLMFFLTWIQISLTILAIFQDHLNLFTKKKGMKIMTFFIFMIISIKKEYLTFWRHKQVLGHFLATLHYILVVNIKKNPKHPTYKMNYAKPLKLNYVAIIPPINLFLHCSLAAWNLRHYCFIFLHNTDVNMLYRLV